MHPPIYVLSFELAELSILHCSVSACPRGLLGTFLWPMGRFPTPFTTIVLFLKLTMLDWCFVSFGRMIPSKHGQATRTCWQMTTSPETSSGPSAQRAQAERKDIESVCVCLCWPVEDAYGCRLRSMFYWAIGILPFKDGCVSQMPYGARGLWSATTAAPCTGTTHLPKANRHSDLVPGSSF